MDQTSFKVVQYDIEALRDIISETYTPKFGTVEAKLHAIYFETYLKEIQAHTIIVEYSYIDRDYLDDYASYYVKCFHDYNRKCTRIHFFDNVFTEDDFSGALSGNKREFVDQLRDSYLGFIVVKPLPKTILGRTCLKTYPTDGKRDFPVTRKYDVNLYGIKLSVKSLAFQEQDQVVAACATSALWSAFHGTGVLFHHTIPTPIEITKAATNNFLAEKRNLPNKGLTIEQMAQAIRAVGLEPFSINIESQYFLKSTIYSYLRGKVPVILVVELAELSEGQYEFLGWHGVTVTGYCVEEIMPSPFLETNFLLRASTINKIYAHDDQVGPFARMEFDAVPINYIVGGETKTEPSISTSWLDKKNTIGNVRAVPRAVIVPLYNKIRIPFELIHDVIVDFNSLIGPITLHFLGKEILWDIFLSDVNSFKCSMHENVNIEPSHRMEIVTENLPRFVWRSQCILDNEPVFELIFDATDIEQGNIFIRAIKYNEVYYNFIIELLKQCSVTSLTYGRLASPVFEWLLKQ